MRRLLVITALVVACGARTTLGVIASNNETNDAATGDTLLTVDGATGDDTSLPDGSSDSGCGVPDVKLVGGPEGCKVAINVVCNDTMFQLRGNCDLADTGVDASTGGLYVCDVDGHDEMPFMQPICSCDPAAWVSLLYSECVGQHQ